MHSPDMAQRWRLKGQIVKRKKKERNGAWLNCRESSRCTRKELEEYSRWFVYIFFFIQEKIKYGSTAPSGDRENVKRNKKKLRPSHLFPERGNVITAVTKDDERGKFFLFLFLFIPRFPSLPVVLVFLNLNFCLQTSAVCVCL